MRISATRQRLEQEREAEPGLDRHQAHGAPRTDIIEDISDIDALRRKARILQLVARGVLEFCGRWSLRRPSCVQ